MTIDEAIERLGLIQRASGQNVGMAEYDALGLGIEALKRVLDVRRFPEATNWKPLPGETEE